MYLERAVVIGAAGLLGEIVTAELARQARDVTVIESLRQYARMAPTRADLVIVWGTAWDISRIRRTLTRQAADADPIAVVIDEREPYVYFFGLREMHVERRRLGFAEFFDEIDIHLAEHLAATGSSLAGAPPALLGKGD